MKWPLVAAIALIATVLLAVGCGDDNNDNNKQTGSGFTTITKGKLKVGSDIPYPPFEFGREPNYEGFDVDLVKTIANKLGLEAEFIKTPFDTIFRNLAQGKFDMVATASTISAEREKEVDFSDPYFAADQSLMVKKGSDIKTVDDLDGKVVGAQLATTGADYAKDKTKAKTVRTYDLIDDAFKALEAGQVEAVINDCPVSSYSQKEHTGLVVVQAVTTNESYGFAFPSDSDALREAFNKELAPLKEDGTVEKLSRKWFGAEPCKLEGAGS
jgi:ABC-type amino acid transport substrate-binding protein